MAGRSVLASSSVAVDVAAIAAAVAAAVPDNADIAAQSQVGAAAAITAAGLATASAMSTGFAAVPAAVDAVIADEQALTDIAGVPAAVDAVISDEAIASAVDTVLARFPDLLVAEAASVAAAGSAEVVAASPGQQVAVYGWSVNAETPFAAGAGALSFFTGDIMTGTPVRSGAIPAGGQWVQEPVQDQVVFSTNTGEELTLANDGTDAVTVRVYYRLVTP